MEPGRQAGPLGTADVPQLAGLLRAAAAALESSKRPAAVEQNHLETVERLTRLFDVSRTLGATFDRDHLTALCVNRVRRALEVDAVYLWLPSDAEGELELVAADGPSVDRVVGWTLAAGEGLAGTAAAQHRTQRATLPEEIPDYASRRDVDDTAGPAVAVAAPLGDDEDSPIEEEARHTPYQGETPLGIMLDGGYGDDL